MDIKYEYLSHRIDMMRWEAQEREAAMVLLRSGDGSRIKRYFLSETETLIPRPRMTGAVDLIPCKIT